MLKTIKQTKKMEVTKICELSYSDLFVLWFNHMKENTQFQASNLQNLPLSQNMVNGNLTTKTTLDMSVDNSNINSSTLVSAQSNERYVNSCKEVTKCKRM